MYRVTTDITIDKYHFYGIVEFSIESSIENFTDTATITIPRKSEFEGKKLYELIKSGMPVTIKAGYDGENETLFEGYVKKVNSDTPVTIECEDAMFLLKENTVKKTYAKVDLKTLMGDILPKSVKTGNIADINLGKFRINNATPAKVLDELKQQYGIYSFFRNNKFYSGLAYWVDYQKRHTFQFEKNIIENGLKYNLKDDVKIQVKAISIAVDNTKMEITEGDTDGELRTFHYFDVSEKTLKETAKQLVDELKYDGYKGTFTAFGIPNVGHGDIAVIKDSRYPEREGSYMIKSVKKSVTISNGYRQVIELDRID